MTGTLIGVGVGPGDPELLTLKGREALRSADRIFVPVSVTSAHDEPGYAERVVVAHVPQPAAIDRLPFELDEQRRADAWRAAARTVAQVVVDGQTAAFATIGDPNVYSTFTYLAEQVAVLAPDVTIDTVPGITAMQDLAARSGTVLVQHEESLTLLPLTGGLDRLHTALEHGDTVVLYKAGRHLPQVREVLDDHDALDRAVFGTRLGLVDQEVRGTVPGDPGPYLSTVIVPSDRKGSP